MAGLSMYDGIVSNHLAQCVTECKEGLTFDAKIADTVLTQVFN